MLGVIRATVEFLNLQWLMSLVWTVYKNSATNMCTLCWNQMHKIAHSRPRLTKTICLESCRVNQVAENYKLIRDYALASLFHFHQSFSIQKTRTIPIVIYDTYKKTPLLQKKKLQ